MSNENTDQTARPQGQSEADAFNQNAVNRRTTFRVSATTISLKAWRMDPHERLIDRPLPSKRVSVIGVDMGTGGIGVIFPATSGVTNSPISDGDKIRLEIPSVAGEEDPILFEGAVTYVRPLGSEQLRAGIEFIPSASSTIARRSSEALAKLLAKLQRADIRKQREAREAA